MIRMLSVKDMSAATKECAQQIADRCSYHAKENRKPKVTTVHAIIQILIRRSSITPELTGREVSANNIQSRTSPAKPPRGTGLRRRVKRTLTRDHLAPKYPPASPAPMTTVRADILLRSFTIKPWVKTDATMHLTRTETNRRVCPHRGRTAALSLSGFSVTAPSPFLYNTNAVVHPRRAHRPGAVRMARLGRSSRPRRPR